ncbi:MAG: caspase family protein [Bacteroidetes bacterium]|nr:caspase family protein [Bacteroidota bacterium]
MKNNPFVFTFLIFNFSFLISTSAQDLWKDKDGAHSAEILSTAISSDGAWMLTGGADKRVCLRDAKTGDPTKIFALSGPVTAVAFNAGAKIFAAGTSDAKVTIFDVKEMKYKKALTKEHTLDITAISFNPISDYIVTSSKDGSAKIWDANGSGSLFTLKHAKAVNGAVFSPDGKSIATASSDNTVKIWEAGTGEMKKSFDADSKEATAVAWSADGKYIASGGSNGKVIIWEAASGNKFAETNFKSQVNSVSFSPDVQYIAAAGADKKIIVWNIETKALTKEFAAHDGDVTGIAFADNGKYFISVSKDMSLKIWDVSALKIGKKKFMKDAGDPKLSVINTVLIEDNHNGMIENPENPKINFTLKNSGKGQAYNLVAKVSIDQTIVGLTFDKEVNIGNLDAEKFTGVSLPIHTDSTLETMAGNFIVDISDANGYTVPQFKIPFQTRGGVSYSFVSVTSHAYSSATGKAEQGAPITLKLKLKNTSSGAAKNVKVSYIFPPNVMAVNKLSEMVPSISSGEEKEISVEFYANKDFNKQKINIGLNLEGAYSNANDLVLEVKMNEPLPTTDIAIAQNTAPAELPEKPLYRGSGDPLKGLNVSKSKDMVIGKYYALIIGVNKYSGTWPPLQNAVADAKAIEAMLKSKYKFDDFKTMYDDQATRVNIIDAFDLLAKNAKPEDNVFIYYSGHGEYKQELNKGFWVPVDAKTNSVANYISNADLQAYLGGIKSKHTLLVADACFSGDIFRGNTVTVPFEESEKYYKEVHGLASRQAMTSGGIEPVMDGGKDGHSVFAYYFLKTLGENDNKFLDAGQVYNKIKIPVINNSEQSPKLAPVKNTGDEGGQFIFIKK